MLPGNAHDHVGACQRREVARLNGNEVPSPAIKQGNALGLKPELREGCQRQSA